MSVALYNRLAFKAPSTWHRRLSGWPAQPMSQYYIISCVIRRPGMPFEVMMFARNKADRISLVPFTSGSLHHYC
jgi:hypothetical protein